MTTARQLVIRIALGALFATGATLTAGTALAQDGCKADLAKFCPQAKPGSGQIVACLKTNAAQLSESCKMRVEEMKAVLKEVDQACEEDIYQFCPGIKPGGGRIAACLKPVAASLTPACTASLEKAKAMK